MGESEHLADYGLPTPSEEDGGAPGGPVLQDPPSPPGLIEGHLVTTTATLHRRRNRLLLGTLVACLVAGAALAGPASAASYRYWSYWLGASGSWVSAPTGPGEQVMVDRDVQGWRFGITAESPSRTPDNAPVFADLCPELAAAEAPAGQVRVAVVIDPGFAADAPPGQLPPADTVDCVTIPVGSTGNQALAAAGPVEAPQGFVCALDGYPAGECGAEVGDAEAAAAAQAAATESPNPAVVGAAANAGTGTADPGPWTSVAGILLVAGLIGAAFAIPRARRRRLRGQ